MQKKKTAPKRPVWVLFVGIVLGLAILVTGLSIINWPSPGASRAQFLEAEKTASLLADRLRTELKDNVASERKQNECFRSEQGPFTDGVLWCQTAVVLNFTTNIGYNRIAIELSDISRTEGLATGANTPFGGLWVSTRQWIKCQLEYRDEQGAEIGLARRIPFLASEKNVVAIACADRAATAYYPIIK